MTHDLVKESVSFTFIQVPKCYDITKILSILPT